MARPPTIRHIISRFIGNGPERTILNEARRIARTGTAMIHRALVLEPPVTPLMAMRARAAGVELVVAPDDDAVVAHVADADLVQIHYWNHPALGDLLRRVGLGPTRILLRVHVLGVHAPQILTADIALFADRVLVSTERSLAAEGAVAALDAGIPVDYMPSVTDTERLAGFRRSGHDGVHVGYLGTVSPVKMHPSFVEMCAAVTAPDVRFIVCGGGGGEDAVRRRADELGLSGRVDVRGHVEDVAGALGEIDVFGYPLAPETYATSEMALQEAMLVGLPPVVFHHGGAGALVTDGESGCVVDDETGYVAAVERLCRDPELRSAMGAAAADEARRRFDPRRWTRSLAGAIADTLAAPRRAHEPLPGRDLAPAARFVASLGGAAGPFATSLTGAGSADVASADDLIARSPAVMVSGDGGIMHTRNMFPADPHLRLWSGLVLTAAGRASLARDEFDAAEALGLGDGRPHAYRDRLAL